MASPTPEEILEMFEELNYPSANKLRAALIKRGYKARLKDVEEFAKSETPYTTFCKSTNILFAMRVAPMRGRTQWTIQVYFLNPGYILKKIWSKSLSDKDMSSAIQELRTLFADEEKASRNQCRWRV